MSQLIARNVMSRLNMQASLIAVHGMQDAAADIRQLAMASSEGEANKQPERQSEMLAAYGQTPATDAKPFAFAGGLAIIPVHGSLINRFGASYGYVTGYNFIRRQLDLAMADNDVKAVIFDCNSYGGEAAGCFELSDDIYAYRGVKPMTAVVDSNCYSACYMVASAADKIVVTPSGGAGSIGVVGMHMSIEKALENFGVKVTMIYAGAHKVDGNPFNDLPPSVKADIQKGVDSSYDKFVFLVARNRGLSEKAVRDTEARIFRADDALAAGLIDQVATPSNAVAALLNELNGSDPQENDMSDQAHNPGAAAEQAAAAAAPVTAPAAATVPAATSAPAAAAPAAAAATDPVAEARQAERTRMGAITGSEEAKQNPGLANHLAMNTEMSAADAIATLKAAGPASAAAPAAAAPAATAGNPFKAAMDATNQPGVGADAANADTLQPGAGQAKPGQKLLSAYALVAGQQLN